MGPGFFAINEAGHIVVRPTKSPQREVDLHEIVVGFAIAATRRPSSSASATCSRGGSRTCMTPSPPPSPRTTIRASTAPSTRSGEPAKAPRRAGARYGTQYGFGLEAGSKPELLAVLGMTVDMPDRPIICNGFKEGATWSS